MIMIFVLSKLDIFVREPYHFSMSHERVGNRIREVRKRLGWTQAQLAERVGIARVSIVAIEKGHFLPTIETSLRLSQALGVPIEELFWLKETSRKDHDQA